MSTAERLQSRFPATLFDRAWAAAIPHPVAQHCVLSLSGNVDEGRLARAVRLTLDADPILGCRFVERWFRPYWERVANLDGFCDVRTTSDAQSDLQRFFEANPDSCVRVLLLRGQCDLLCVKFDHLVGDAKALQEYVYLLANTYNRLGGNPAYVPAAVVDGGRSLATIGKRLGLRERWRIVRHIVAERRRFKELGQWRYPNPRADVGEAEYISWRLDPEQVTAIFDYGYRHRATVSHVLLAAFYLAVRETLPHTEDLPLPVTISVDLRRYLPAAKMASSNLVGNAVIAIAAGSGSLDEVVEQIQQQMKAQRKYLGLAVSFFPLETFAIVRHLASFVPYGLTKRRRHKEEQAKLTKGHVPGMIMLSNGGDLDPDRLAFDGVTLVDAYATAGVLKIPGLLAIGVCGFRGALTLHLGCGPASLVASVSNKMMQVLPKPVLASTEP